ncbi:hypothetical protein CRYUN_Cryun13aG0062800 [Craigia yunnanensis]
MPFTQPLHSTSPNNSDKLSQKEFKHEYPTNEGESKIFVPIVFRGPNGAATGVGAQYSPVWFLHAVTCTHHLVCSHASTLPCSSEPTEVPGYSGLPAFQNGDFQMFSIMYPAIIPGLEELKKKLAPLFDAEKGFSCG